MSENPDVHLMPWEQGGDTDSGDLLERLSDVDPEEDGAPSEDEPIGDEAEEEIDNEVDTDEDDDADEPEDDDSDEDSEDEGPLYEVTLPGGEKAKVSLEELTKGYSRTQDYTRKTQALAEERKAIEAETNVIRQAREHYADRLSQVESALQSLMPQEPDWARLQVENPTEYAVRWAQWQQSQSDLQTVRAERQRIEAERQHDFARAMEAHLVQEREKLVAAIPEWQDTEVATREKGELRDFAKSLGYTDDEVDSVYDHRLLLILRDAYQYRKAQKATEQVKREKKAKPQTMSPGGRKTGPSKTARKEQNRARNRLARTGSVTDAAAAIMGMLDD